jgi:hypothetical protein
MATEKLSEIRDHLEGIKLELESLPPIPADAMTYTELKMQLMVNYVSNLSFYLGLKQKGESVKDHPVFHHLALLRTFLERLAPLDASLKYQIEKLLLAKEAIEEEAEDEVEPASGPNLSAFMTSATMKNAVKGVSVEQVKKAAGSDNMSTRLEIDPSLIAARIARLQTTAGTKKSNKKKIQTVDDDELEGSDLEEIVPKKKKKTTAKKTNVKSKKIDDDEEIDSDFEL